jgi:hypothetical protein
VAGLDPVAERVERVEARLALVGVGEHQETQPGAVLDVVAEAVFLQEPRDEREVALVVLDAVGPHARVVEARGIGHAPGEFLGGGLEARQVAGVVHHGRGRVEGEVGIALKDGLDDAARGLLQEDAAPGPVSGPDERGHEDHAVEHALGDRAISSASTRMPWTSL